MNSYLKLLLPLEKIYVQKMLPFHLQMDESDMIVAILFMLESMQDKIVFLVV